MPLSHIFEAEHGNYSQIVAMSPKKKFNSADIDYGKTHSTRTTLHFQYPQSGNEAL